LSHEGKSDDGLELIQAVDTAPLDARYWIRVCLIAAVFIVEFFDLFIVGFIMSAVGPAWGLTYGQTAIVLLSAGVGAIFGALVFGVAADRFGRKGALIAGIVICGISSGLIGFTPDGDWLTLAALRFFVGVGVGGSAAPAVALVVELTPTRVRTVVASAMNIPAGLGVVLAAAATAALLPLIGWRGLALVGFAPLVLALACWIVLPESLRWLVASGRHGSVASAVQPPVGTLAGVLELLQSPRRFWLIVLAWIGISTAGYGVVLWGPTIIALLLEKSPQEAAALFGAVGISALAGRAAFSILPQLYGRKLCGQIMGLGAALALACAALFGELEIAGVSVFLAMVIVAAFFYDGGAANLAPYAAEIYPVRLAARAAGLGAAANGLGRILGPLCLALVTGADQALTPAATVAALTPGFLLLAGCALVVAVVFTLLGIETHRRALEMA
jgi:MFS transporter, putative metabolite:H+ symporter